MAWAVFAQEPPKPEPGVPVQALVTVLENTGKPMQAPLRCTQEDIAAAGLECTEQEPCQIFLELSDVVAVGTRLYVAGNLHAAAVTLSSTLLGSENGGSSWTEAVEPIRGAGLDRLEFLDPDNGWAAGEILGALPRNPFLLHTIDGGKSWKRREIFNEEAESHLGTIQQMYFSSKEHGLIVIDRGPGSEGDRYERYESQDGGDSWMILESSSKAIALKRPERPAPEWRVRADGPTQAFLVERREGQSWSRVAAFAVKAGVCKPE
jgi:photosystem II stability/assembly factor-like uncharacterized protein